jgi:ribosome-associated protein
MTNPPTETTVPSDTETEPRDGGMTARQARTRQFAIEAARLLGDLHCEDILLLDVRGLSQITDYLLIGSGTSDRQIHGVSDDVQRLAQEYDLSRFGRETDERTVWAVLDFVEVMVHLFEPATRAHYDLEMLWGDAPRIDWRRR